MNQNNNDKIYPPVSHMVTHLGRLWHSCFLKRRASAGQDWSAPSGSTVKHTHTHTQIKWNTCSQTHHWKQFNNSCFSLKYYSPANVSTTWTESKETNKINSPHRQIKLICAAGHWWLRTSWPISNTIWTSKNKKASKQRSSETEQISVKTLYSHSDFWRSFPRAFLDLCVSASSDSESHLHCSPSAPAVVPKTDNTCLTEWSCFPPCLPSSVIC